jgi:uncharacterized protein YneF (UPF0154 family)
MSTWAHLVLICASLVAGIVGGVVLSDAIGRRDHREALEREALEREGKS